MTVILLSLPAFYLLVMRVAYRKRRIVAFLDPWQDPQNSGFQIIQSLLAMGTGGIFGQGLGAGKQKLFYLPEAHTDFILAVIGEELYGLRLCPKSREICRQDSLNPCKARRGGQPWYCHGS
jgi:cell division protein FtsW